MHIENYSSAVSSEFNSQKCLSILKVLYQSIFYYVHCTLQEEKYYLRSLGEDPRKDIADVRKDFPTLAPDIVFPPFFEDDKFYSSVFRISSQDVQLWTHYDVRNEVNQTNFMLNVYFLGASS